MRTFQDRNFLVWEVYPSGGKHGFSDNPHIVFNCLTQRDVRPRFMNGGTTEADAERRVVEASPEQLIEMLDHTREIP